MLSLDLPETTRELLQESFFKTGDVSPPAGPPSSSSALHSQSRSPPCTEDSLWTFQRSAEPNLGDEVFSPKIDATTARRSEGENRRLSRLGREADSRTVVNRSILLRCFFKISCCDHNRIYFSLQIDSLLTLMATPRGGLHRAFIYFIKLDSRFEGPVIVSIFYTAYYVTNNCVLYSIQTGGAEEDHEELLERIKKKENERVQV